MELCCLVSCVGLSETGIADVIVRSRRLLERGRRADSSCRIDWTSARHVQRQETVIRPSLLTDSDLREAKSFEWDGG